MEDCTKTTWFLKAINGGTRRGGLFCQLKDQDLNRYIMSLANEFQRNNPDAFERPKIAPVHHSRQDGDIWVLNESCQIDGTGNLVNIDNSQYKWIANYRNEKSMGKFQSKINLPLRKKSLSFALQKLKVAIPGLFAISRKEENHFPCFHTVLVTVRFNQPECA